MRDRDLAQWKVLVRERAERESRELARDVVAELACHLVELEEAAIHRGASEADARRQALDALNAASFLPLSKRPRARLGGGYVHDVRVAVRRLTATPVVTIVAVMSLAFGIGANTAIFSLFNYVLRRPLPVPQPYELVNLGAPGPKPGSNSCGNEGTCDEIFSYPTFRDLEREQDVFTGIAAHVSFGASLAYGKENVASGGVLVSGSYFPVLGLTPAAGRLFSPADDATLGQVLERLETRRRIGLARIAVEHAVGLRQPVVLHGLGRDHHHHRGFDLAGVVHRFLVVEKLREVVL